MTIFDKTTTPPPIHSLSWTMLAGRASGHRAGRLLTTRFDARSQPTSPLARRQKVTFIFGPSFAYVRLDHDLEDAARAQH
jgi:hypothetical protein